MSILTVVRTTIQIASIDAYTAGEVSSVTGAPINYLSECGLAESIGLEDITTLQNRVSKELKTLLGNSFVTLQGKYKNAIFQSHQQPSESNPWFGSQRSPKAVCTTSFI